MSNPSRKQKAIHYKRVAIGTTQENLQSLLCKALGEGGPSEKANNRKEQVNQDEQSFRLINHHSSYSGMIFGQLVFFESGASQPYIDMDDEAQFYSIDALTTAQIKMEDDGHDQPEDSKRKKKEFLNSILYFGALDNHLVLMQSSALKSRDLETHLNWLLSTQSKLINNSPVILHDKPSEKTVKKLEKKPVKTVKLGSPIEIKQEDGSVDQVYEADSEPQEEKGVVKKLRFVPNSPGAQLIRALVPNWLENQNLTDALDDANLQVSLEITYMRKTTASGQRLLDSLSASLRHIDDSDVRIDLHGGGTISGSELKLSGKVSVKTLPSGLLDENDLYHQMHSWLVTQIENDQVEASN